MTKVQFALELQISTKTLYRRLKAHKITYNGLLLSPEVQFDIKRKLGYIDKRKKQA